MKKEKRLTAQFVKKKTANKKIGGLHLVNKKATQTSFCTDVVLEIQLFENQ